MNVTSPGSYEAGIPVRRRAMRSCERQQHGRIIRVAFGATPLTGAEEPDSGDTHF